MSVSRSIRYFLIALSSLLISQTASRAQTNVQDGIYFDKADSAIQGTLFVPANPNGKALVAIHELGSSRLTMQSWCDTLAAHGYVVMTIDYPDPVNQQGVVFPQPVSAAKAAIQYLRRSAGDLHIGQTVGLIGRSLGAYIAAGSMIDEGDYAKFGIDPSPSDHADFAVLLYGLYDFTNFTQTSLPIPITLFAAQYFQNNAATQMRGTPVLQASHISQPLLLIHGKADQTIQYQQSQEFYDSLKANGKNEHLILVDNADHLFEVSQQDGNFTSIGLEIKDSVLAFLSTTPFSSVSRYAEPSMQVQSYPNPVTNATGFNATILLPDEVQGSVSVTVTDIVGRVVMRETRDASQSHSFALSFAGVPAGSYYCIVRAGNMPVQTNAILISK